MKNRHQTEARVMILFGIINQLLTTRYSKLFQDKPLSQSQFGVLNHFTHAPERSWLISDLSNVMEMNQPGITKIVSVLHDKKLLKITPDKKDKRKRHLKITNKGLQLCKDMIQSLLPDVSQAFSDWPDSDVTQLHSFIEKLTKWLDENRL